MKRLSEQYGLPVKVAFSVGRGYYFQLYIGQGHTSISDREVPTNSCTHTDIKAEDLPNEFLKITKHRNTFSFTTADLMLFNSKNLKWFVWF